MRFSRCTHSSSFRPLPPKARTRRLDKTPFRPHLHQNSEARGHPVTPCAPLVSLRAHPSAPPRTPRFRPNPELIVGVCSCECAHRVGNHLLIPRQVRNLALQPPDTRATRRRASLPRRNCRLHGAPRRPFFTRIGFAISPRVFAAAAENHARVRHLSCERAPRLRAPPRRSTAQACRVIHAHCFCRCCTRPDRRSPLNALPTLNNLRGNVRAWEPARLACLGVLFGMHRCALSVLNNAAGQQSWRYNHGDHGDSRHSKTEYPHQAFLAVSALHNHEYIVD
jgi:hypothetical protein